jgi:hypothetical protein
MWSRLDSHQNCHTFTSAGAAGVSVGLLGACGAGNSLLIWLEAELQTLSTWINMRIYMDKTTRIFGK